MFEMSNGANLSQTTLTENAARKITGSQSARTLDYKLLVENMVIRKFGKAAKREQLAKFLGFESGIIPKYRITSLRNSENSLDIDEDGSVSSVMLARWLIHKNRLSVTYAVRLFGDKENRDLLLRFPRTWKDAAIAQSPYYFDPNKQSACGHLNIRRAANRECLFCIIDNLNAKSQARATKRIFGGVGKEAESAIKAFDQLPAATRIAFLNKLIAEQASSL